MPPFQILVTVAPRPYRLEAAARTQSAGIKVPAAAVPAPVPVTLHYPINEDKGISRSDISGPEAAPYAHTL